MARKSQLSQAGRSRFSNIESVHQTYQFWRMINGFDHGLGQPAAQVSLR